MTSPVLAQLKNPYPGLAPFDEQDAAHFFGRDREIEDILERLASRRLLAVMGVSGGGKSSLVRAGVIPVLRIGAAQGLPGRWRIRTIKPGNAPLEALRTALEAGSDWPTTSFGLVDQGRNLLGVNEKLLLVVDQFEELFRFRAETLKSDAGNEAALFVNLLLAAVDQPRIPIYLLLTMRTDFLGECAQFRGLPEALNDCYYLVPRLTRLQQQGAIEEPLREQGIEIAPTLVQRLLNDSDEDPDDLPVLQHLLRRLWQNWNARREDRPITTVDYEDVGGWKNAIDKDAEEILSRFQTEQPGIRRLFQWITERGTGERPIRRPRPLTQCVELSGLARERLSEIIYAFQERLLLQPSDRSDSSLVDLPHESVMWQWSRLDRWIAEEAEEAAQLRFLLQSARQKVPLVGLALESALRLRCRWQKQNLQPLRYVQEKELQEIATWIDQSERLDREQRQRRTRRFIEGAVLILLAILTIVVILLRAARHERDSLAARELARSAALSLDDDPERGLILGLHSWNIRRQMEEGLEETLHEGILQQQSRSTLRGHKNAVWGIAWSPDGRKLATASSDKTAKVWDAATGHQLLTLRGDQGSFWSIAWSPDGRKLAAASEDKTAKVWDAATGRELLTLRGHQGSVWSIAWSPDGSKLATASDDKTAKVWDAATGRELLTLRGHQGSAWSIAWSRDGSKLASAGDDKAAKVWEAVTGRELLSIRGHKESVMSITWSPDGSKFATASSDKTAKVWDAHTGQELLSLPGHKGFVWSIAWSPDGSKLATASSDKTAKLWDAETGRELLTLRGHTGFVWSIAWSPVERSKLATASWDYTAKLWDSDTGYELCTLRGHQGPAWSIAWSPDGSKLATASSDKTAKLWAAETGRELLTLRGHQDAVRSVAWSPDGRKLATASSDKTGKVWEVASGRELLTLRGHGDAVWSIAWSPDGRKLATASSDKTARVWEASTGRELLTLRRHQGSIWSIAWSPDGRKLATASWDTTAKVWDAATGDELHTLAGHQGSITNIAWSPDGKKLATASEDKTAKVWPSSGGDEILTLEGHQGSIASIAWSRDGKELVTASWDNTANLWDAATGREVLTLPGRQTGVLAAAWSPGGKHLALTGSDGIAQVFAMDSRELLRLARSRISRDLTKEECRRYLNTDYCPPLPRVP